MVKKLGWKNLRKHLLAEARKSTTFLTFGTIGSCNLDNDIDLIITKKPSSRSDLFYKDIHNLFRNLDKIVLKKWGRRVIRFSKSEEEFLLKNLSSENKHSLMFHTMIYNSYDQMEREWGRIMLEGETIEDLLKKNYTCIIGKYEDLFSDTFKIKRPYDPLFNFLYIYDKTNSNYPPNLLVNHTRGCMNYLFVKRLGIVPPKINTVEEAVHSIYIFCSIIDCLNKESMGPSKEYNSINLGGAKLKQN